MKRKLLLTTAFALPLLLSLPVGGQESRLADSRGSLPENTSAPVQDFVTYEQYGAVGDGMHDDQAAIVAAHDAANQKGLAVKATAGRIYYIGKGKKVAVIKTDVDWTGAKFIIDDVRTEDYRQPVFRVVSSKKAYDLQDVKAPGKGQKKIAVKLAQRSLVLLKNDKKKIYIRRGLNRNNGQSMKEVAVVEKNGKIRNGDKIIWDYGKLTAVKVFPMDETLLTIRGGEFTTRANQAASEYKYRNRGIEIRRSNVLVENVKHYVTGELDHGAPYSHFIMVKYAADVVIRGCLFTAHKVYRTIGAAKQPVSMGTYDVNVFASVNVRLENCRQTTDIDDTAYWGVFTSNYSRDLHLDNCIFSRFDAHQGVCNVYLKNSVFGHQGIRMVGFGLLSIDNCECHARHFVTLRNDYGSSWDGEIEIKNCEWRVMDKRAEKIGILSGSNDGSHDFGYRCKFPSKITISALTIEDERIVNKKYKGPFLFCNFKTSGGREKPFPYLVKGSATLRDITISGGKELSVSSDPHFFDNYKVRFSTPCNSK